MSQSIEQWALDYIAAEDWSYKLDPPPRPELLAVDWQPRRDARPGRGDGFDVRDQALRTPRPGALRVPERRAQLFHTFLHHELQAAELMAWAVVAFPESPEAFRRGLLGIMADEIRHMGLYRDYLGTLGFAPGDFPVRDWFWQRVPQSESPLAFVSVMGMGLEAGNLDHAARFAEQLRSMGDDEGAALQERVCFEEISHVRFATGWYERLGGAPIAFDEWSEQLPAPLSPMVMRGRPLNRDARRRAGLTDAFMDALASYEPHGPGF